MGALIVEYGGTLEHFAGDGMMVFFNDPVPQPDHVGARSAHGPRDARAASTSCPRSGRGSATNWAWA